MSSVSSDRRRLGVCVLGLGEMGQIHAQNLAKIAGVDLFVASCRPHVAEDVACRLFASFFTSYADALACDEVDAVVIATQPKDHPKMIMDAAHAGKHIFSEKPLGYDPAVIWESLVAVEGAKVRLVAGFMRRFDPGYANARARVDQGELGHSVLLKCNSGDAEYPEKYQRDLGFNSMLLDLGVHDIDLARWLLKSEVKRVYACCDALVYPNLKAMGDSDLALLILEMDSGAKAMIHLSRALGYGYNVTSELVCSRGSLGIGVLEETPVTTCLNGQWSRDICPTFAERFRTAFAEEMVAFVNYIRDGEYHPGLAFGEDGWKATIVAEALVASWKSGLPVDVTY